MRIRITADVIDMEDVDTNSGTGVTAPAYERIVGALAALGLDDIDIEEEV